MALLNPQSLGLLGAAGGLLQASGPSPFPVGAGQAMNQGLLGGLQGYGAGLQFQGQQQQQQLQRKQMELIEQELATKKRQFDLQQQLLGQFGLLGANAGSPTSGGLLGGQTPPGMSPETSIRAFGTPQFASGGQPAPQAPQQSQQFPFSPTQMAGLQLAGMPNLTGAYNASQLNVDVKDGIMYDKKSGRVLGSVPTMNQQGFSTQLVPDGRGGWTVQQTPGGLDAYTAQQDAAASASARRDPFMGVTDAQGRPIPMTREQFSQRYGGQGQGQRPASPGGVGQSPADKVGSETVAREVEERNTNQWETTTAAVENLNKLDTLLGELRSSDAITGMGAELFKDVERMKQVVAESKKRGKVISDTELLNALLGSDVFPMIKQLGIGARGLDTPAEREFLREVMSGTIQMNKETLIRMTEIRRNIAERAIDRWNERLQKGELTRFYQASGMQPTPIVKPLPKTGGGGQSQQPKVVNWDDL